jgi:activator of HSP90 ATPase
VGRHDRGVERTAESIHQERSFAASRRRVYDALTISAQFDHVVRLSAAMRSGMKLGTSPTAIHNEPGGTFTLFGGHIHGRFIELVPSERIVQAWRVANWDPGIYSIARYALSDDGTGTKLVFDHTGFPPGEAEHLAEGWDSNYWEPLTQYLTSVDQAHR